MSELGFNISQAFSAAPDTAETILRAPPPLIELLPIAVYACDAAGRLRWFNRQAVALWGRTPPIGDDSERYCGSHKLFRLDGTLLHHEASPMALALRTGEPVAEGEVMVERPDGTRAFAIVHINPLKDASGQVIGAINCLHDITARKDEGRKLRERERQFRELLDALPAAIYTTDTAGRITYYNEAAVDLAGRRPIIGRDEWCVTWKLYTPDGTPLPHDECPMAVALKERRAVRGCEAVAERPDGIRVPFIPYPTPLYDSAGNLAGAVNMLVDISHRKDAETQQRLLFSELNHRTKNNMQMLHGLLDAARRETTAAEARDALGDAMKRLAAMAAAHTALYHADNLRGFEAREFLLAVCASARQACGPEIKIEYDADDGELANDTAAPLGLILNELITNAIKHGIGKHGIGARGGGTIKVKLLRQSGERILTVADDGPGFEPSQSSRRSSGLGLVIGLARQIGGSFSVESGPGAHCTVRFPDRIGVH